MEEAQTDDKVINLFERRKTQLAGETDAAPLEALPEFITPGDIDRLNDAQLEQLLNIIRMRRLQSTLVYEKTVREKETLTQSRAREMLEKKSEQVWKELDAVFKKLEKLELRVNEMRALRLQAGLEW